MSDARDMAQGWFVGRHDGTADGSKTGPYAWDQMVSFAREGRIAPTDLVWHESMPEWAPATSVQGLMPAAAPAPQQAPQPAPAPQQPAYAPQPAPHVPQTPPPTPPKKTGKTIGLIVLALAIVGALGAGAFFLLGDGDGGGGIGDLIGGSDTPDLGVADTKLPDTASLIQTADYGEVPANQIGITLLDGFERAAAEAVASTLGGTIVGEIEYISSYQIEFPGSTEADLFAALDTAAAADGVEFAYPNQQVEIDDEIWGVRVTPYADPVYGDGRGLGYEAAGVGRAWEYIKGASVDLNPVKVGVIDEGLYREGEGRENEFGGDVKVTFPDAEAAEIDAPVIKKNGKVNTAGSHGTAVATVIGADPDNGGPAGVGGPLGDKLELSMINFRAGKYGTVETTANANDPTQVAWTNGKSYALGGLVAIAKQIQAGSTIINCSWGNPDAPPGVVAAYKKFFEKMATDHPNVLFVCSAGNTGEAQDGSKRTPSGLALSNMITVGSVNNDGTLASYSTRASDNFEVTLGAPGTDAVVGLKDGVPVTQSGTSFSTPMVAAAAAMLRSIDKDLSAADIKRILVETARPGITVGDTSNLAPPEVGGRVLAIDQAVLKVINDTRVADGKPPLDPEELGKLGVVDAVAISGDPDEYTVKGIIEAAPDGGTSLSIAISGQHFIGGSTSQSLEGPGETIWDVTLPEGEGVITVSRSDSGASSVITIQDIDINGLWSGTFTITDIQVDDAQAAEDDGCTLALVEGLIGAAFPATLDVTADESGSGSAIFEINGGDEDSEPQNLTVRQNGSNVTFTGMEDTNSMTATVTRQGQNLVMSGNLSGGGDGWRYTAVFSLSKPE